MKFTNSYFWHDIKWQIVAWFNPRQKWLTKKIPKTWCDKDTIIQTVLFECLINYVEAEKGLQDTLDWSKDLDDGHVSQAYVDRVGEIDGALREVYNYITKTRPELEAQLNCAYPDYPAQGSYEELYGMVNKLEKTLTDKDTWAMQTIVELREYMWT